MGIKIVTRKDYYCDNKKHSGPSNLIYRGEAAHTYMPGFSVTKVLCGPCLDRMSKADLLTFLGVKQGLHTVGTENIEYDD